MSLQKNTTTHSAGWDRPSRRCVSVKRNERDKKDGCKEKREKREKREEREGISKRGYTAELLRMMPLTISATRAMGMA